MNIIAIVILVTLIIDFLLGMLADGLNLKHLTGTIPKEFQDVYKKADYEKSQNYIIC